MDRSTPQHMRPVIRYWESSGLLESMIGWRVPAALDQQKRANAIAVIGFGCAL